MMEFKNYRITDTIEKIEKKIIGKNRERYMNLVEKIDQHPRYNMVLGAVMHTFENLSNEEVSYGHSGRMSLIITHNDTDGMGVAVIASAHQCMYDRYEKSVIIHSDAVSLLHAFFALHLYYEVFDEEPRAVYIGDVAVDIDTIAIFREVFPSTEFYYADHHITNDLVAQKVNSFECVNAIYEARDGQLYDLNKEIFNGGCACLSAIDSSESSLVQDIVEEIFRIGKEDYDKLSVSATALMLAILIDPKWKDDVKNNLSTFARTISQWDTFEWRDHPQFNVGYEHIFPYALTFFSITQLTWWMCENMRKCIHGESDNYISEDIWQAYKYGEKVSDMALTRMKRSYVVVETGAIIDDDADVIGETMPWYLCVVEFPHAGNQSMVFHQFMTSEIFEELEEKYGSIALATVSLDCNKLSFRSKGDINVSTVAKSLGGGGHKNAAGCDNEKAAAILREAFIKQNTQHN